MTTRSGFLCTNCRVPVPVPEAALRDPTVAVVCPNCGQRYQRRPSGASRVPGSAASTRPPAPGAAARPPTAVTTPPTGAPAAPPQGPALADGTLLAGRWRIVRFLARGGMGEVYEAEDAELRERVALKTIHPAVASQPASLERFKREIHLARKVTHPNVCRLFEFGTHVADDGAATAFLTMELLEGETLSDRVRRRGPMGTEAVLPIARQIGAALTAAHAAGVVHRDLKGDNIFLVPGPAGGERVVVTDFGIARGGADDRFALTATSTGGGLGTPAYMAPEQVTGEPATAAADQYALGVLIFELLTGELPFRADTPLALAAKRLTEAPPSLAERLPALDPRWAAAVGRALGRYPDERFGSVAELVAALDGESPPTLAPALDLRERRREPASARSGRDRRMKWLAALLGVALVGASAWAVLRLRSQRERTAALRPVAARTTVAVVGLRNLAGRAESAWLGTAIAEMLATELAQGGELRVVPGDAVTRAVDELELGTTDRLAAEARVRLRARLAADYLVLGGFTALGDGEALRFDLRLEQATDGEAVETLAESGRQSELFDLVSRAGSKLRARLGASASGGTRSLLPASPEAARLYAEGLERLRRFDPEAARERLERAVELDPGNALARSSLAVAWAALGYDGRAAEEARRAYELASTLPEPERWIVEARWFESAGQWQRAAEVWQALWSAAPDNLDYGLRLAATRTQAGEVEAALAAIGALRALPEPDGVDPRLDLAEAAAAAAMSDYRRQAEAAKRAAARAETVGGHQLAAQAHAMGSWALRNLGRGDEALAAAEAARELAERTGDRAAAAEAMALAAAVALDRGDLDRAAAGYESALATSRELGDRGGAARALNNLAVVRKARGELDAARRQYEEAESLALETGNRRGAAYSAQNVAVILADLGELDAALARLESAREAFRELADPAGEASALASLGAVRRRKGELAEARKLLEDSLARRRSLGQRAGEAATLASLGQALADGGELTAAAARFEEALAIARELSQKGSEASALAGLGEIAAARGDLAAARGRLDAVLELRRSIGDSAGIDRARLALARLALDSDPEGAAREADELLAGAGARSWPDIAWSARILLARAALARGDARGASEAVAPLAPPAPSPGLATSLERRLLAASAAVASAKDSSTRVAAAGELDRVAGEAAAAGLLALEIEGRLAAAEISGGGGQSDLGAVAERARAAGYLPLARRAEARQRP
jgi:tetratricopeptide (TPR) repeat protein/tRNA A-37 threonylcarbamoyl transferase component Bud32/TolB-like protein